MLTSIICKLVVMMTPMQRPYASVRYLLDLIHLIWFDPEQAVTTGLLAMTQFVARYNSTLINLNPIWEGK